MHCKLFYFLDKMPMMEKSWVPNWYWIVYCCRCHCVHNVHCYVYECASVLDSIVKLTFDKVKLFAIEHLLFTSKIFHFMRFTSINRLTFTKLAKLAFDFRCFLPSFLYLHRIWYIFFTWTLGDCAYCTMPFNYVYDCNECIA